MLEALSGQSLTTKVKIWSSHDGMEEMIQNFTGERRERGDQSLSVFLCGALRAPVNMIGFLQLAWGKAR